MILNNRSFTRREPEKDAKSIYIFCEGRKREYHYFRFFQGIDSRINVVVHQVKEDENNSPTGLFQIAMQNLIKSAENPAPKHELLPEDEVWFVIDTDFWGEKITELRRLCQSMQTWEIAQSNPCFEVWLYYHFFEDRTPFQWPDMCQTWKNFISEKIPGGFNSNKHPVYVASAILKAERRFEIEKDWPAVGCTEVFRLAKIINGFCGKKIDGLLQKV